MLSIVLCKRISGIKHASKKGKVKHSVVVSIQLPYPATLGPNHNSGVFSEKIYDVPVIIDSTLLIQRTVKS